MKLFSLAAFKILSLSLIFGILIMMSLGLGLCQSKTHHNLGLCAFWNFMSIFFTKLENFSFITFSNRFPISCSFSYPSGMPVLWMSDLLKLKRFRAKTRHPAGRGQAAPPEASLGATGPTLDISGLHHRVPGVLSVELEALPATQRSVPFPVDHTCQRVSHPGRGRVPRKN